MAQGPAFRNFDGESEEWQLYKEQLEQYFAAHKVEDGVKKAVLINHCEPRTYKLLRDLCTPAAPADKTYEQLCTLLSKHFTPPVVVHKERRCFWRAKRSENETVNAWAARIKNLASNCRMENHLEHDLLNKFIDGLDGKAFDRICEEDEKLTFERAYEIALKYEPDEPKVEGVFQFDRNKTRPTRSQGDGSRRSLTGRCLACDKPGHYKRDCRFKDYICKRCNKRGHLQVACSKQRNFYMEEQDDLQDELSGTEGLSLEQNFISKCDFEPIYSVSDGQGSDSALVLRVKIESKQFQMQLDTGAAVSVVSWTYYCEHFRRWKLRSTNMQLKGYSGEKLKIKGVCEPVIEYDGLSSPGTFAVIENGGPPLLGRNFVRQFQLRVLSINAIDSANQGRLQKLVERHRNLFNPGLGTYKHCTVNIELEENAQPMFRKPRSVAYKLVDKVSAELDMMAKEGIISKCDNSSWGTPLVPVIKGDGNVRLCGDYKTTVNRYVKDVIHPLPTVDEVFSRLNGGQKFSKLDLSKCYNQFLLNEESREVCAISTNKGVYKMNRLPFGIRPASGIVQRELEKLLCGIRGVQNFLDDVLVTGRNDEEHLENLAEVFEVLEQAGLKLNQSKCQFFKAEVTYLGHVIGADGLRKTEDRVKAIRDAKEPENAQEVRAFAGLVNHYARFVNGMSDMMYPLYRLLKKGEKFLWTKECKEAFAKVKREICRDVMLAHFNPKAELLLVCDASMDGISAVLVQKENGRERPVAFASRVLHSSERNYSVIDREGLAIVFGLNKFFHYLVGNIFTIRTDHKPLLSILNPSKGIPQIAASRMQRWANFLAGFSYKIEHVSSQSNIADYPSRAPFESWKLWKEDDSYLNFLNSSEEKMVNCDTVRAAMEEDKELMIVKRSLSTGEFVGKDNPYRKVRNELSLEDGLVMRGIRLVIPRSLREIVLQQIHRSHLGIVKSKSVLRSTVWWPKLDEDLEAHIKNCTACLTNKPAPEKATLVPWNPPKAAWSRVHLDFAGPVHGTSFLLIVDALSKWVEVFPTAKCDTEFVLDKLTECISRFGIMDEIVCDNGTQFTAGKFRRFLTANGIRLLLTSPGHPATNGQAENAVKTFKASLIKSMSSGKKSTKEIVANFLMGYRSASHCTTGMTPAQIMLGRQIRTSLDLMKAGKSKQPSRGELAAKEAILERQFAQIRTYHGSREVEFSVNDKVMVRDYTNPNKATWTPAVVIKVLGSRNYLVRLAKSGREIKRHVNQIITDTRKPETDADQMQSPTETPALNKRQTRPVYYRTSARPVVSLPILDGNQPLPDSLPSNLVMAKEDLADDEASFMDPPLIPEISIGEAQSSDIVSQRLDEELQEELVLVDIDINQEGRNMEIGSERSIEEPSEEQVVESVETDQYSEDSDKELELIGFDRGFWKFRDYVGRVLRK